MQLTIDKSYFKFPSSDDNNGSGDSQSKPNMNNFNLSQRELKKLIDEFQDALMIAVEHQVEPKPQESTFEPHFDWFETSDTPQSGEIREVSSERVNVQKKNRWWRHL